VALRWRRIIKMAAAELAAALAAEVGGEQTFIRKGVMGFIGSLKKILKYA